MFCDGDLEALKRQAISLIPEFFGAEPDDIEFFAFGDLVNTDEDLRAFLELRDGRLRVSSRARGQSAVPL